MSDSVVALNLPQTPQLSKAAQFRAMLASPELAFIMEAHNGLSAKIVEEAGFKGIWASGLSLATAMGVRDRNEASWTQVIEILEFMSDATSIPIMLDGDTGYGDFNNFRRLVAKLCQRDIAAVCIEDKIFPKTNSFVAGDQSLADIDEFCGKIKAGKDSQSDPDFSIVARIEALIAGWGLDEALKRAEAYHTAGADALLIHSKKSGPEEILAFAKEWGGRCPVVIVPTTYYATPTERFRDADISLIIWANHNLRASINAMREVSRRIQAEESLVGIERGVAPMADVFGLAGNKELAEAESKYMAARAETRALVLAASRGSALEALTEDRPKCMLDLRGEPLLRRMLRNFNDAGVRDVTVVCGYKQEAVDLPNIKKVVNDDYAESGEVASLVQGLEGLEGPAVIAYGDIIFESYILDLLLQSEADVTLVVDAKWREHRKEAPKHAPDLVICDRPYSEDLLLDEAPIRLEGFEGLVARELAHGEWIGLAKFSASGLEQLREQIAALEAEEGLARADMPDLFNRMLRAGATIEVIYVAGHWLDVNDAFDLAWARNML